MITPEYNIELKLSTFSAQKNVDARNYTTENAGNNDADIDTENKVDNATIDQEDQSVTVIA